VFIQHPEPVQQGTQESEAASGDAAGNTGPLSSKNNPSK